MQSVSCSACGRSFVPRFSYQTTRGRDGRAGYFCSVACRTGPAPATEARPSAECSHCGKTFQIQYALQTVDLPAGRVRVCSEGCRAAIQPTPPSTSAVAARVLAVLNQKGGTGKTTTAVTVAAGLAQQGAKVLLVDTDPQGSVAVCLGVVAPRGLYHVLVDGLDPMAVAVPARANLWAVTADRTLSAAELALARQPDRWRVMARAFEAITADFDYVVIDCAPSVSLIGHNALALARDLVVPMSCDYLALVGVKQVLRTVHHVNESLQHPVRVLGVLPTFFDVRNRICRQSVSALEAHFGDRVMPVVRVSTAFKEAPSVGRTIFEHAPKGRGAEDYRAVVEWIRARSASAGSDDRSGEPARPANGSF